MAEGHHHHGLFHHGNAGDAVATEGAYTAAPVPVQSTAAAPMVNEQELKKEHRHKREGELAAAAALGYGLHERHEKKDAEKLNEPEKKHHHLF